MRKTKEQLEKITKYSIRKLSVGVGPVAIGVFLFGASTFSVDKVQANEVGGTHTVHYRYLAEQELTESEKALIHHEVPVEFQDDDVLYVVYRKKATTSQYLPYTGSKELALAGLGLATASLAVFLVSKKGRKEVLGVLLIASLGASTFVPYGTFAFENKELVSYNQTISASTHEGLAEGVIHIDGYEYIGYFKEAELHLSKPAPAEKSQLVPEKQALTEKLEPVQEIPNHKTPVPDRDQTSEKPTDQNPASPSVEEKQAPETPQTRQETSLVEIPFETVTRLDASLAEGQTRIVTAGVNGQRRLVTKVSIVNGQEVREVVEDQVLHTPVTQVVAVGIKREDLPSPTPVRQAESRIQVAKGTQEEGHEGESLVQDKLPEYKVTEGILVEESTTELDYRTETIEDPTKYTDEETVVQNGEKGSQVTKTTYKTVEGIKTDEVVETSTKVIKEPVTKKVIRGNKPIEGTLVKEKEVVIPFETKTQEDATLKRGTTKVAQEGVNGRKQITETYKTVRGEKTTEPPTVTETVIQAPQDKIIKQGTKGLEKPTLQWSTINKDVLKKSATASYTLNKLAGVTIKSIKVALKNKAGQVVKEVAVEENKLQATLNNLEYYKGYTLSTTMVYDRGEGEETETLEDKEIQLDLKKVEIKNIRETTLMKVDAEGNETDSSLLSEKPIDIAPYYLRVTTHDNKVTRLAVTSIEDVVENGEAFYKVVAKAPDLVQHVNGQEMKDEYSYYIAKPKQKIGDVYYDFNELVTTMQANPNGHYKIGQNLNATNVKANGKSYITTKFTGTLTSADGNRYAIHNLASPLFNEVENATIKDLIFSNVNINKPNADQIATIAKSARKTAIENIKVTGSLVGGNDVAGIVNNLEDGSTMINVAVIAKLKTRGTKGWSASGLINNQRKANVSKVYTDVEITGNKARASALVSTLDRGINHLDVGQGHIKYAVAKGTINIAENVATGGLISKNWPYGLIENAISYVKVKNGEKIYGSSDINDSDFAFPYLKNVVSVEGISEGNVSFDNAKKLREISKEEADSRTASYQITAVDYDSPQLLVDKLNNIQPKADTYKDTQDYNAERELAYRNIEKLQPFYNKEWIVNQGNKIPADSKLLNTEVLSVTGMKNGQFVTDLSDVDHIMIHYADGTKEEMSVTAKTSSNVEQIKEYSINGLADIVYTPNMVVKDRTQLINDIKAKLASVELISPEVRNLMDKRGKAEENTDGRKDGYIRNLFLEESFKETKENLEKLVKQLVENEDHQLNKDDAAMKALLKKVEDNKAKIMMGLTYLNRYYGFKYGDMSIKDIMTFKPDFYGKSTNVLDRLIQIGSREHFLKGDRTQDAYRDVIAGATGKGNLNDFLTYNMKLFTEDTDMNVWYKKAVSHTNYIVEKQSSNPAFANKKYHLYENLNNGEHGRYILPLLNTKKAHMFLISTYNTLAFSAFEKYGKNTEAEREAFKKEIDLRAQEQINYLDFWSRLAADNVRNQLLKSENMVPSAIWDNHGAPGGWVDRMGHTKNGDYAPIREFYGPTGKWHGDNGMGAYAYIFENPQNSEAVYYIWSSMISDFGTSAFTHETTHINDRMAYLGGWRHREGTDVEAFAQGMLQSPAVTSPNGDYGALGLNMAYKRQNDGNQIYNYDPNKLDSREKIDHYMKNYNEALMMLDYLEADAVIKKNKGDNNKWFKKMDKKWRTGADRNSLVGEPHQWDLLRELNDEENKLKLTSIDQLIEGNFVTKHGMPGNQHYRAEGFDTAYQTVNMMSGIYGGNTSKSTVGSISFKHNTFRMWGYFGYIDGFVGYASNKYKQDSKKAGHKGLGDDFIIDKVSKGRFQSLETWKKAWYHEVHDKAQKGFVEIEINGEKISTYAKLQELFDAAVEKDLNAGGFKNTEDLKWKVYKQLLYKSDGFSGNLFNESQA